MNEIKNYIKEGDLSSEILLLSEDIDPNRSTRFKNPTNFNIFDKNVEIRYKKVEGSTNINDHIGFFNALRDPTQLPQNYLDQFETTQATYNNIDNNNNNNNNGNAKRSKN